MRHPFVYARLPSFPIDSRINGILYSFFKIVTPWSRFCSPVNHLSSLSDIFKIWQCSMPYEICFLACSKLSHKGSLKFGSKERIALCFLAIAIAFCVAALQFSCVIEREP